MCVENVNVCVCVCLSVCVSVCLPVCPSVYVRVLAYLQGQYYAECVPHNDAAVRAGEDEWDYSWSLFHGWSVFFSLCVSDWCDSRILWHTVMCVCASCCRTPWLS